jgi:hypothetical protein
MVGLTRSSTLISIQSSKQIAQLKMAKTETLNLRVAADFKRRLMEEAGKEKRSVTNYLEVVLTEVWEHRNSRGQRKVEKPAKK